MTAELAITFVVSLVTLLSFALFVDFCIGFIVGMFEAMFSKG